MNFSTLSFSSSVLLTKDTLYWISIAWQGSGTFYVYGHGAATSSSQVGLYDNVNNFSAYSFPEFPTNFSSLTDGTWWRIKGT